MKREIKFRAWLLSDVTDDEDSEQVWEMVYDLAFEEYAPINDLLGGVTHLMQFTGIKDKNGKDIYDGDIVKLSNSIRVMEILNNCFWFIDKSSSNKFPICMITEDTLNSLTVIGNIYENANLLT